MLFRGQRYTFPTELTIKNHIFPTELTIKNHIFPTELMMKNHTFPTELTIKAVHSLGIEKHGKVGKG